MMMRMPVALEDRHSHLWSPAPFWLSQSQRWPAYWLLGGDGDASDGGGGGDFAADGVTKQMAGATMAQQSIQKNLRNFGIGILISVMFAMNFLEVKIQNIQYDHLDSNLMP